MATKKITLNELRSIVKQIIKESDLGDVYAIKQHLESITAENLDDFRHEAFISMDSCNGYSLGVNGKGMYVVKGNNETYLFQSADAAVERYKECASD